MIVREENIGINHGKKIREYAVSMTAQVKCASFIELSFHHNLPVPIDQDLMRDVCFERFHVDSLFPSWLSK